MTAELNVDTPSRPRIAHLSSASGVTLLTAEPERLAPPLPAKSFDHTVPEAPVDTALHPLLDLTDEEVLALAGEDPRLAMPYARTLTPEQRTTAATVALRSLIARSLVSQVEIVTDDGEGSARALLDADLATVLDMRSLGHSLAVRRTVGGGVTDYCYVYVLTHALLVEDVSASGVHRFSIGSVDGLGAALQERLVGQNARDGRSSLLAMESLDVLAEAHVVADIVIPVRAGGATPAEVRVHQVYTGPRGCFHDRIVTTRQGSGLAGSAISRLVLDPLPSADVGSWIAGRFAAVRDGEPGPQPGSTDVLPRARPGDRFDRVGPQSSIPPVQPEPPAVVGRWRA